MFYFSVPCTDDGACLKYLLTKCDPEEVNNTTGLKALHVAAQSFSRNNSLSILLSSHKVNVNSLSAMGDSVLHTLVKSYATSQALWVVVLYSASLDRLLRRKDLRVNHQNRQGCTAIHCAAERVTLTLLFWEGERKEVNCQLRYHSMDV